jgi:hypothetical protein
MRRVLRDSLLRGSPLLKQGIYPHALSRLGLKIQTQKPPQLEINSFSKL